MRTSAVNIKTRPSRRRTRMGSCLLCGNATAFVSDSRYTRFRGQHAIRRRRTCTSCKCRYTTYERVYWRNNAPEFDPIALGC